MVRPTNRATVKERRSDILIRLFRCRQRGPSVRGQLRHNATYFASGLQFRKNCGSVNRPNRKLQSGPNSCDWPVELTLDRTKLLSAPCLRCRNGPNLVPAKGLAAQGAANRGRGPLWGGLSAGSFGARALADGPKSRLKGGRRQDCPPHNKCRIPAVGKAND